MILLIIKKTIKIPNKKIITNNKQIINNKIIKMEHSKNIIKILRINNKLIL